MSDLAFYRSTGRSTKPEVGRLGGQRCAQNVHDHLTGRPVDHPESSASGSGPGRPGGRLVGLSLGTVDRAVDRQAATVRNLTVGRSTGRSTDNSISCLVGLQRLVFGSL